MYIALYEMKAKEGYQSQFEKAWAEVTDFICHRCGSLGSRLHKTDRPQVYFAYAQWPDRETYIADGPPPCKKEKQSRMQMKEALEYVKTIQLMDVVDDRLKSVK